MACDDADTLDAKIVQSASGPKRAKGDAGEVEMHSLKDQVEAAKYLRSKCAGNTRAFGLRVRQGRLPSATGRNCDD